MKHSRLHLHTDQPSPYRYKGQGQKQKLYATFRTVRGGVQGSLSIADCAVVYGGALLCAPQPGTEMSPLLGAPQLLQLR